MFGAMANTNEEHIGGRQSNGVELGRDAASRTDEGHTAGRDGALCRTNENTEQNTNTTTKETNEMPIFCQAPPAYELVERGEHPARITTISEPEQSKFDPEKESIKITFELTGGPFEGQLLGKYYTLSLSKMASLGKLYRTLVGKIDPGQRVDVEQLIGRDCAVQVTHKIGDDDEQYAVVQDVFKPAKDGKGSEKEPALSGSEVPF